MNWSHLFNSTIRTRGRQYYRSGAVGTIQKSGNIYTAAVKGSRSYRVSITIQNDSVTHMSCTCPYAAGGSRCKHMAAVLCKLDHEPHSARETSEKTKISPAVPISRLQTDLEIPGSYSYFKPVQMLKGFSLTEAVWNEMLALVQTEKVVLERLSVGFSSNARDDSQMQAVVEGSYHSRNARSWSNNISLVLSKKQILQGRCHIPGCFFSYSADSRARNSQPCVHQLALFYLAVQQLKKDNPGDATDCAGSSFLYQCRSMKLTKNGSSISAPSSNVLSQPLELNARIHETYSGYEASFRVGSGKMFVIKDLDEFVQKTQRSETALFGSSTHLKLDEALFTPHAKRYYNFIQETISRQREHDFVETILSGHYFSQPQPFKQTIPLFGSLMDRFYEVLGTDSVEFIPAAETKRSLICRDSSLPLSLTVSPVKGDSGELEGVQVSGQMPDLTHGKEAAYYVDGSFLNRISSERMAELLPLPEPSDDGTLSFTIGRRNLSHFCYSILPWLKQVADVTETEPETVAACLPPQVHFTFYLDAEKEAVICQAKASYGDEFTVGLKPLEAREILPEPFRDRDREQAASQTVLEYFPVTAAEGTFYSEKTDDAVFHILDTGLDKLLDLGEVQTTDRFRRLGIRTAPKVSVGISLESGLLDLTISADSLSNEELAEILKSYRLRRRFHRLKSGDFIRLEDNTLESLSYLSEELGISPKELAKGKLHLPAYRSLYLNALLEESRELYSNRDRRFKEMIREFKTIQEADFELPSGLNASLRPYQISGYRWLRLLDRFGFGGILADEMGLGKTLQALSVLAAVKEETGRCTALIITPASLVYNWYEELQRFTPSLKAAAVTGTQAERRQILSEYESYDVLITSYDLLKRDIGFYEDITFSFQFLDEAQYIKNHATAAAKAVKVIHSRSHFALTGTPIENRLSELWSIFDYLMPGFLYTYEAFKKSFEIPVTKSKDEAASARLHQMTGPFILRRLKKDVLNDLPEKLEEVRYAKAGKTQQELYDSQLSHMKEILSRQDNDDFNKNKLQILAEITRLRQICCDPTLCFENYKGGSAKRETCMELIRNAADAGHRMLVFSQFTTMLERLETDLKEAGISYFKITGSTPKEQRIQMVNAFNSGSVPVFLISLKAGGTGLNLTGADVVIHYDPWWNLAVQNQATDRAHRLGQTKTVTVYKLIMKNSIEEKILKLQEAKKDLADQILTGELGNLAGLSREELLEIIG